MLKRVLVTSLAALAVLLLALAPGAVAGEADGSEAAAGSPTGAWFVEFDEPASAFMAKAKNAGIVLTKRFEYTKLWKGVSVQLNDQADIAKVRKLDGVRAVFPVLTVELGPTNVISPELAYALALTGADVAQDSHGITGEGVKVGVIDSGVDYHHPDLGAGFGPGHKVVAGWDFVGDRFNAAGSGGKNTIPHPDADPDDCGGHGTHVAGIIGAKPAAPGGIKGVAPDVKLGAYRVFGCAGSTNTDIMQAAMERAYADGMDVINMSIGSSFTTWPEYPSAVAADTAAENGVVVVASIGNSGRDGVYSAGAPGVGRKVIGVASFDNSHIELLTFTVSPDGRAIGYMNSSGEVDPTDPSKALDAPTEGSALMARTSTGPASDLPLADACSTLSADVADRIRGRIALIRRGSCTFRIKVMNAQAAGAIGVVLYNNAPGAFGATVAGATPAGSVTIPVVTVSSSGSAASPGDGETLNMRIAAAEATSSTDDDVRLTWTDDKAFSPNVTSGLASSFTSYGLTAELGLKPNIGAPGGFITSTYPLELEGGVGRATLSGTSMSSPHVAGTVALLLSAQPALKGKWQEVLTVLQNSADPVAWTGSPAFREPVHRQGAGMVDIDDAICTVVDRPTCPTGANKTIVSPGQWALGEGSAPQTRTFTLTNGGSADVTYTVGHLTGLGTASTFVTPGTTSPTLVVNSASMSPSSTTVVVPAGGSATVNVTITPSTTAASNKTVYGGWIQFTKQGSTTPSLRVPYAGFRGNYQDLNTLGTGGCESTPFPAIFKVGGSTECKAAAGSTPAVVLEGFTKQAPGTVFNVEQREDRPVLLYQLAHQARRLELRAENQATGQSYLVAFAEYVRRTATNDHTANGFFSYRWDGKYIADNGRSVNRRAAPTGTYRLTVRVTEAKAFNDDLGASADSFESASTAPFAITR